LKSSRENEITTNKSVQENNKNGPSNIVKKFWDQSLKGNTNQAESLITYVPKDFWVIRYALRKCDNLGKAPNFVKYPTESKDEFAFDLTVKEIESIKRSKLEILGVEEREYGEEALVEVEYGLSDLPSFRKFFLLKKENNEWKIFMITPLTSLIDEDFATDKCYQP
jgi:hypothetical protein